jgi:hypothetical protein
MLNYRPKHDNRGWCIHTNNEKPYLVLGVEIANNRDRLIVLPISISKNSDNPYRISTASTISLSNQEAIYQCAKITSKCLEDIDYALMSGIVTQIVLQLDYHHCLVCLHPTIPERGIKWRCEVCGWVDAYRPIDTINPKMPYEPKFEKRIISYEMEEIARGTYSVIENDYQISEENQMTLTEARRNYSCYGAVNRSFQLFAVSYSFFEKTVRTGNILKPLWEEDL